MFKTLLKKSPTTCPGNLVTTYRHLILRVVAGLMIFYIHGWHKLEGLIAYLRHGTAWQLLNAVAEMHFPAPFAFAVAATLVQLASSLFVAVGFLTRINALLLVGVLSVAILQNVLAGHDPQLAILYTLVFTTLALMGGRQFSLNAKHFQPKPMH
ncbi:DoxX family protein [Pedosphaera parvula]|uniref:DoxX family protein n=1 Tax=Pedosphaera parvula (strain Ellin514) TaxID=320771 RepID=B9XAI2_PEDPL|nr:DoxX family protein [Pedosphaera parvula]EEF63017.1 DoxX family protein [Pedosphaera parvula Ellin514]